MTLSLTKSLLATAITASIVACSHSPAHYSIASPPAIDQGKPMVTFLYALPKEGGESVRKKYIDGALPLARAGGMVELQDFKVKRTLSGKLAPSFNGLYAWPNTDAAKRVRESPEYTEHFWPLRSQAWSTLTSVDVLSDSLHKQQFNKSKTYTSAIIWLENKAKYEDYVNATTEIRKKLGAKFIALEQVVRVEALPSADMPGTPDYVGLIEWSTPSGPNEYLNYIKSNKELQLLIDTTFKRVDWMELGFFD